MWEQSSDDSSGDRIAMLRGTASGLEFVFGDPRAFNEAAATVRARLADRPGFYNGSTATAVFDGRPPDDSDAASSPLRARPIRAAPISCRCPEQGEGADRSLKRSPRGTEGHGRRVGRPRRDPATACR